MDNDSTHLTTIPYWEALLYWLRLGFISFGGPAGQISIMHQELVEKKRWISERRFLHALNFTMVLPGPEAQQLATYIGWLMHGIWGGLTAGILFVLPSLFILIGLTWIYLEYGDVPVIAGIFYGIKPAVAAIVAFAAYRIGKRAIKNNVLGLIAVLALLSIAIFKVPFPYIIIAAGLIGLAGSKLAHDKFKITGHVSESDQSFGPALIDDNTPLPEYAEFRWTRFTVLAISGVSIWIITILFIVSGTGWQGTLTQMAWFFTKAALVTFGGAYAVLPYVYQGGVEQYAWLTGSQMIDGLALGETTPGPLIMIVTFVGFVGGWTKVLFGPELQLYAGIAGAVVATFFTFLPSFLFIFMGAPFIESTRHDIRLTAPLTGITAAVVGVILNLALFFTYHVLWPDGFSGNFEIMSAIIGVAALIALFRFRMGIITVIGISAIAGFLYTVL